MDAIPLACETWERNGLPAPGDRIPVLGSRLVGDSNGVFFGTTYRGGAADSGTVFCINHDGSGFRVLHHFSTLTNDGRWPFADLIIAPDGMLYGTTELGGLSNVGSIFRLRRDGSHYEVIFHFGPATNTGSRPRGHLELGTNGAFFGTTQSGGVAGQGVIYTINPNGSGFRVLHHLQVRQGGDADAGLTLASNGKFYGSCSQGDFSNGTLFRINHDGSGFTNIHVFGTVEGSGYQPKGRLVELTDGLFCGVTYLGGARTNLAFGDGTIYTIRKDGSELRVLKTLFNDFGEPGWLHSGLVKGAGDRLFAVTYGYPNNHASIIAINSDGSDFRVLKSFEVRSRSPEPVDPLIRFAGITRGTDGWLYGIATSDAIFRFKEDGTDFSILHEFEHLSFGSSSPESTLIKGSDGLFYGTSLNGGYANSGTVFILSRDGSMYRQLHVFGRDLSGGSKPNRLVEASDGYLYGTTQVGPANNPGVIFKLGKDGTGFNILRQLSALNGPRVPLGGLIEGIDGWLYGSSSSGGTNGRGTIFKLLKDGSELRMLHSFTIQEGYSPIGELVQAGDGTLFGVTQAGSISNYGAIFRIAPEGTGFERLHDFIGDTDGQRPRAGLIIDDQGTLFGTATSVGRVICGTVFRLNQHGTDYQVMHRFAVSGSEGRNPAGPLAEGEDGLLYGTTSLGGLNGQGTIFRLRKDGTQFSVLWNFPAFQGDGQAPFAGLAAVGDGSFLGTTRSAGAYGNGTVFRFDGTLVRLSIANRPPVEICWPASSTIDQLEQTDSLNPAEWRSVPWTPTREGATFISTVPSNNSAPFFRLRRHWQ